MKLYIKSSALILSMAFLFFTGCGDRREETDNTRNDQLYMDPKDDTLSPADTDTNTKARQDNTETGKGQTIIHEGIINVKAIDTDKDGSVYQCPMDWNVISDNSGSCPQCKMDLEKFSVAKAEDNLVKNDYKVKK